MSRAQAIDTYSATTSDSPTTPALCMWENKESLFPGGPTLLPRGSIVLLTLKVGGLVPSFHCDNLQLVRVQQEIPGQEASATPCLL